MTASIFERTLASAAMVEVFADRSLVAAMLAFEAALAEAEAAEGVIPASAVAPIVAACRAGIGDIEALVAEARSAGSLAIPLVKRLTAAVAERDAAAAAFVHHGSTSQDVIDTAMVLATKRALGLIDADLARLTGSLHALARAHLATPMLARTLLQPAQVISFGFKIVAWLAPLVRARSIAWRGHRRRRSGCSFGGAVGTLASLGDKGPAVARVASPRSSASRPATAPGTSSATTGSRSAARSPCCAARSARSAATWRCSPRARSARSPSRRAPAAAARRRCRRSGTRSRR